MKSKGTKQKIIMFKVGDETAMEGEITEKEVKKGRKKGRKKMCYRKESRKKREQGIKERKQEGEEVKGKKNMERRKEM